MKCMIIFLILIKDWKIQIKMLMKIEKNQNLLHIQDKNKINNFWINVK